jgi:prepilin-type N-terminal cleavage/methylation domain-containing protein
MPVLAPPSVSARSELHSRSRTCPQARSGAAAFMRHGAFTLLELLTVIAVLGIVTAIVTPRYGRSIARTRADAAMERMLADIRRTQALANASSTALKMDLDVDSTSYILPKSRTLDNQTASKRVRLDLGPYFASTLICHLDGKCALLIDAYGRITSTGAIEIRVGREVRWIGVEDGRATGSDQRRSSDAGDYR